ncbi:MAG TPA: hypothetical protein VEP67_09680 [Thiobacillaceae bacterium]|nr:hypothetical protein [Thiobacillaceae bacterium]
MNQDSLMGKFEALMRKHRGGAEAVLTPPLQKERQTPSPDAWLPVLTDVVQRGSPPPAMEEQTLPAAASPDPEAVAAEQGLDLPLAAPALESPDSVEPSPEPVTVLEPPVPQESAAETLDAQSVASLLDELAPKITGMMQEQVAEELRKSLDQSMVNLMANLNANVEEIVRQVVAEKLAGKDKKSS